MAALSPPVQHAAQSAGRAGRRVRTARPGAAGFTLLELLVAISILAMVSLIAWRGLETLVSTRVRLEPEGDDVRALLIAFGQLDRDFAATVSPRFFTSAASPVEVSTIAGQPALAITRIAAEGSDAPTALQVIGYRVEDGVLVRSASRPTRGRGTIAANEVTNVRILDHVKSMRVRLWRDGQGWYDPLAEGATQPVLPATRPGTPGQANVSAVPPGVEVTLERSDGKLYRRVLLVG